MLFLYRFCTHETLDKLGEESHDPPSALLIEVHPRRVHNQDLSTARHYALRYVGGGDQTVATDVFFIVGATTKFAAEFGKTPQYFLKISAQIQIDSVIIHQRRFQKTHAATSTQIRKTRAVCRRK